MATRMAELIDVESYRPTAAPCCLSGACHAAHRPSEAVAALLAREEDQGFCSLAAYASFAEQVKRTKRKLLSSLIAIKDEGKTIAGYGAPGKGNTLLNYCGIGTDFLDFTVDRNPYKHGRFTPGMHIPIRPVEALEEARPDYIFILPWNLKQEIIQQLIQYGALGAKFIVPIRKFDHRPKDLRP